MVALDHIADLQVLMIDGVVLLNELERRLVMKVRPLAVYFLMRFRQ